jgi:hypothetical protein
VLLTLNDQLACSDSIVRQPLVAAPSQKARCEGSCWPLSIPTRYNPASTPSSHPATRLGRPVRPELGERDYHRVFTAPSPRVIETLEVTNNILDLCRGGLPSDL